MYFYGYFEQKDNAENINFQLTGVVCEPALRREAESWRARLKDFSNFFTIILNKKQQAQSLLFFVQLKVI